MTTQPQHNMDSALKAEIEALTSRTGAKVAPALRSAHAAFVDRLFHVTAPADVLAEPAHRQELRTTGLWQWGATRAAKEAAVNIYNPPGEGGSWRHETTFIEIISDDMPFLVDSVSLELARLGLEAHLLLHPVFHVQRDAAGALTALSASRGEGLKAESWMHISISRQPDDALEHIRLKLLKVLGDVRLAVEDWRDMRSCLSRVREQVPQTLPKNISPELVQESLDFLDWVDADHFVYLGYREYHLKADNTVFEVPKGVGRGLLRDDDMVILRGLRRYSELPEAVRSFLRMPEVVIVNKAQAHSTVHRSGLFDVIGIKQFDNEGRFVKLCMFIGLFTSMAYNRSAQEIPLLRRKVDRVVAASGHEPGSHNGKALIHILNTYPRDDLFQMGDSDILTISRGILLLAERHRTALFVWRDPFGRFVSCLIYTPRDRYDTALRQRFINVIEQGFEGRVRGFSTGFVADSPLVRLHAMVDVAANSQPLPDLARLEGRLIELARGWDDDFADSVMALYGAEQGQRLRRKYAGAFPEIYRTAVPPQRAASDLALLDGLSAAHPFTLSLHAVEGNPAQLELRLFHHGSALALSDILPGLENMGLRILSEVPYVISNGEVTFGWISELRAESRNGVPIALERVGRLFTETFQQLWQGGIEDDRFNQLVLREGLSWREVAMLRAYGKYLQQAGFTPTQSFIRDTLAAHGNITVLFVRLFHALFDPARQGKEDVAAITADIEKALDAVSSLAEDEVLRRYLNLLQNTLRTNYYQVDAAGQPKAYLSFKLDSQKVTGLPLPRPLVEIWVYAPRVEGVHLRGGRVARGGLRWSDRRDDFRTEVLGLMKAQMVKNAVIVPVGSKGGFYCKKLPADRAAEAKEVVVCYQTFIRGLLDITDNQGPQGIIAPLNTVRRDQDDPYLVVAADKGTAKFSDTANALSLEYGFWLGDGFASGGSAGYDHKHMGITARGAWEAVKRHFREIGTDVQTQNFTCVGVGDMAGDVFGNGMLRSDKTLLIAAFNHKHIFLDPNPDAAASFAERQRLFDLPGSQWSDYAAEKISKGGGVFERSAKSIALSDEVRARFGLAEEKMAPNDLIKALLKAEVDLVYLGGIGTYIKAESETNADVNDRANDALRINGAELRAKVIGEGANLGVTARARIEMARRGVRLNSDAIDNSAGVDTSDHEVNIKIALNPEMAAGRISLEARNKLLESMTDDVAGLVLRDNYLQTQLISLEQARAPQLIDDHARLMETLEKAGRLDRKVEFLPGADQITQRVVAGEGLTRPEIALLVAHAKLALNDEIVRSTLPDEAAVEPDLITYFPAAMQQNYLPIIKAHRLKREIISTVLSNEVVNRMGTTFAQNLAARSGYPQADVVRAYLVVRSAFDLPAFWAAVEALDNKAPAATQLELLQQSADFASRAVSAVLEHVRMPMQLETAMAALRAQAAELAVALEKVLPPDVQQAQSARVLALTGRGVPLALATRAAQLVTLAATPDVQATANAAHLGIADAARIYYALGSRLGLDTLRSAAEGHKAKNYWQRQMAQAVVDDLFGVQQRLAVSILQQGGDLALWCERHAADIARADQLIAELQSARTVDLAMLAMASRSFKTLAEG